jgi:hypothetical protein
MNCKQHLLSFTLATLCGSAFAAPEPVVLWDDLLAEFPEGAELAKTQLLTSENGQFVALDAWIFGVPNPDQHYKLLIDVRSGERLDIATNYPAIGTPESLSASAQYVVGGRGILNVKTGEVVDDFSGIATISSFNPFNNSAHNPNRLISDNGRYVAYAFSPEGCLSANGYVYDQATHTSTLATPRMGTTDEVVCANNQFVTESLLSGDGKRFFWGTDGEETALNNRWGWGSPNTRDLFAHDWATSSVTNTRVSNCNGCGDTNSTADTTSGSSAYEYDVSANGQFAVFRSFHDYGFGKNNVGMSIYVRNLATQEVELISDPFVGIPSPGAFSNPSISSDGRFVAYDGSGSVYLRDRQASTPELLEVDAKRPYISGDGKTIFVLKDDGWYRMANPYLETTTDFDSNYLFVTLPHSENQWQHFEHMILVDDHTWVGYLDFDGQNGDQFKFDVGGQWDSNGELVTSADWSENYGDNNADGSADLNGANISVTQGAGRYKISFYDDTKNYVAEKLVDVTFSCHNATTVVGQSTYVVGNIAELGNWSLANAIKLDPTSYPTWTGTIAVPSNVNVEWKCVKREELDSSQSVQWQPGGNNSFNASANIGVSASF